MRTHNRAHLCDNILLQPLHTQLLDEEEERGGATTGQKDGHERAIGISLALMS